MKSIWYYLIVLFLFVSCHGQENNKSNTIDASKVKEITITNKVYCSLQKLTQGSIVIKDRNQIEKIIDAFTDCKKTNEGVNMSMAYGFFEIDFNEGEINHYYTINYTVYDGVIVRNDNNGDRFKNDRLEGVVSPLFIAK